MVSFLILQGITKCLEHLGAQQMTLNECVNITDVEKDDERYKVGSSGRQSQQVVETDHEPASLSSYWTRNWALHPGPYLSCDLYASDVQIHISGTSTCTSNSRFDTSPSGDLRCSSNSALQQQLLLLVFPPTHLHLQHYHLASSSDPNSKEFFFSLLPTPNPTESPNGSNTYVVQTPRIVYHSHSSLWSMSWAMSPYYLKTSAFRLHLKSNPNSSKALPALHPPCSLHAGFPFLLSTIILQQGLCIRCALSLAGFPLTS